MLRQLRKLISPLCLSLILLVAATTESGVFVHDPNHGNVRMGVKSDDCDNGETNLDKDWDGRSTHRFTCTPDRQRAFAATSCHGNCPRPEYHLAEPALPQLHMCSKEAIRYSQRLPTNGPHRPLWPVWGRYSYVPPQRWLHSVEHGGIVALYHPCAPAAEVEAFTGAVARCLRRHVIAADAARLTPERPFAVIAFQNKMLLAQFNLTAVQEFIVEHALKGPEHLAKEGDYSLGLIRRAEIVSDFEDSKLCPSAMWQAGT